LEIGEEVNAVRILADNKISHLWMETDITARTFHRLPQVAWIALKSISLCQTYRFTRFPASSLPILRLPTTPLQQQTDNYGLLNDIQSTPSHQLNRHYSRLVLLDLMLNN
jgi:hypothetical protein